MSGSSNNTIPACWQGQNPLDWEALNPRLWQGLTRSQEANLSEEDKVLIAAHFPLFSERCLKIKEKSDPGNLEKPRSLIPFRMNNVQRSFLRKATWHDVVLKSRKHGFSTLIDGYFFWDTIVNQNVVTMIVSNSKDSSALLMETVKTMYNCLPEWCKPEVKYNSKYEMSFPARNSKLIIATAGEPEAFRGSDITNLHCSESAFWAEPEQLVATLLAAGPPRRVVFETTANGIGGWFYDFYHKAKSGRIPYSSFFFEWMLDPSCRLKLARGEDVKTEAGLDFEQTKFIHYQRAIHGALAAQEYPMNDVEAFVSTSRSVFDMAALDAYLKVTTAPRWHGDFGRDGKFYSSVDGSLKIWAAPNRNHDYVIGADVSEGIDRGDGRTDYSTAVVIDKNDMDIVAVWKGYIDPDLFADELKALGIYFGGVREHALIGVENAFFGGTTLNTLQKVLKYPWVYYQTSIDKRTNVKTDRLGWRTDAHSKPMMISELGRLIREGKLGIPDQNIIEECRTFVRLSHTNGAIMGSESGCHDDLVMAAAIAVMMCINQPIQRAPGYVETVWDPWKKAKEEKKRLERDGIADPGTWDTGVTFHDDNGEQDTWEN